jgi:nicotinamidase-related amidase
VTKVLLLIDYENEWADKKSDYYLGNFKAQLKNARRLLDQFRSKRIPVVFTRHVDEGSTKAFAEGARNTEIIGELNPLPGEKVITKHRISPFFNTDLDEFLRSVGADEVVIGGIMTNLCVRSAVADAYDRDLKVTVVKDVCVSDSPSTDRFTFRDLKKTRPSLNLVDSKSLTV